MGYKTLYSELANEISSNKCYICDEDYLGYCVPAKGLKGFIYIKASMSYKERFFTLAHEAGHLFTMLKGGELKWCNRLKTEQEANTFAVQYMIALGINVEDYRIFYNKASKRNKKKRKSWHHI